MKKILIIGSNSKIAIDFLEKYKTNFHFIKTFKNFNKKVYNVDLSKISSINNFLETIKNYKIDGIIIFGSLYEKDELYNKESMLRQIQVNFINILYLIENIINNNILIKKL